MKKENIETIIIIIGLFLGLGLMLWGTAIMRNYDGYLEIMRAARRVAAPQYIGGLIILFGTYFYLKIKS